jgi:hypothetical protein
MNAVVLEHMDPLSGRIQKEYVCGKSEKQICYPNPFP